MCESNCLGTSISKVNCLICFIDWLILCSSTDERKLWLPYLVQVSIFHLFYGVITHWSFSTVWVFEMNEHTCLLKVRLKNCWSIGITDFNYHLSYISVKTMALKWIVGLSAFCSSSSMGKASFSELVGSEEIYFCLLREDHKPYWRASMSELSIPHISSSFHFLIQTFAPGHVLQFPLEGGRTLLTAN